MMRPKAIFFDVGNTLLFPNPERILRPLHERQVFPSEELLRALERETKREFDSLLARNSAIDHGFWHLYYSRLLKELGLEDESICADLVRRTRVSGNWCDVRPGTREALEGLRRSYRLAVISNSDGKIRDVLAGCGIADVFETITDSGIVGKEKPHPAIFEAALHSLGIEAQQSLYVGDVYSLDYLGAWNVGMRAILFDVSGAYEGDGLPRVKSLVELEAWLGHNC
jgi:putative hydrolase of the HAD superfamily